MAGRHTDPLLGVMPGSRHLPPPAAPPAATTVLPGAGRRLDLPAGPMHYLDAGDGPAVIMVHGNPTWSFLFRDLVARLSATHRCVAPDHLGFGLSGTPADRPCRPAEHAGHLARLVETLGLRRIVLVGHDWGGPVALAYAASRPDNVAALVLSNTWAWPVHRDPRLAAFAALAGGPPGRWLIRHHDALVRALPLAVGDRQRLSATAHRCYRTVRATPAARDGFAALPREMLAARAWLAALRDHLPRLGDTPALLAWGMRDPALGARVLGHWRTLLPHARVHPLAGVGHLPPEEAPAAFGDAVTGFLAEDGPGISPC
ncbi:Haloalkane dehalogenase 2 [wastewater metagenome]|uniref:Haloalkane dehalogenase 2 n=4 Tax=root TaxID=1 RepID=A0A5B8R9Z2_9ZZZZ|nr:alpha/beta fold hydrolase [Arhodomonas aquaeolei]QEA06019.1 haloalkane dehalogenase 2 [uncultured organism]